MKKEKHQWKEWNAELLQDQSYARDPCLMWNWTDYGPFNIRCIPHVSSEAHSSASPASPHLSANPAVRPRLCIFRANRSDTQPYSGWHWVQSADPKRALQGKLTDHQHAISSSAETQCPLPGHGMTGLEDWGQCFAVWQQLRMSACKFSMAYQHLHQQHFTGLAFLNLLTQTFVFTVTLPPIKTHFPLLHCTTWCQ